MSTKYLITLSSKIFLFLKRAFSIIEMYYESEPVLVRLPNKGAWSGMI